MRAVGVHAFLADAVTRADGKLYAHGAAWNVLGVPRLPAIQAHLGLAILFTVPPGDDAPHEFAVRLEDPEGEAVALGEAVGEDDVMRQVERVGGTFRASAGELPPEAADLDRNIPVALAFNALRFASAGRHRFVIVLAGGVRFDVPFAVVAAA